MATKCANCPLRQKDMFAPLSPDEVAFMQRFKSGELVVDAGTPLLMEGSNSPQLFTVLYGMGLRYKVLANGNRQVLNFVMPGDFVGLQAGVLGEMGHSVEASTAMTLCVFDRSEIWHFIKNHPERAYDLTWLAAIEEHFMGETVATIGQRTALQAVAWALLRVFLRGQGVGLVHNQAMRLPYRQQDLADALGLSLVHTNKTLAILRERQLASWLSGELRISDTEELAKLAQTEHDAPKLRPIM